jgi:hypothetical protein
MAQEHAQLVLLRDPSGPKGRAKLQHKEGDLLILAYAPAAYSGRTVTLRFPEFQAPAKPEPAETTRDTVVSTDIPPEMQDAIAALLAKWQAPKRKVK